MNGNDVLEFEEANIEMLCAEWVKRYGEEPDEETRDSMSWFHFVLEMMQEVYDE